MAKRVSWNWGGKKYYGTLIRETKTHKFARTKTERLKRLRSSGYSKKKRSRQVGKG